MIARNLISGLSTKDYVGEQILQKLGMSPTLLIPMISPEWKSGYPKLKVGDLWFYPKKLNYDGSLSWTKNQRKAIIDRKQNCYAIVFTSDYLRYTIQKLSVSKKKRLHCNDVAYNEIKSEVVK